MKQKNKKNKTQKNLERQLEEYEQKTSMTGVERHALRKWVKSGHSVYEAPISRYPCGLGLLQMEFLDSYRADARIDGFPDGKTRAEKEDRSRFGSGSQESPQQKTGPAPEQWRDVTRKLGRELYHLWNYLGQENLWEEAKEYVEEHAEEPSLFEEF